MMAKQDWQWLVEKQEAAEQFERNGRYADAIAAYSELVARDPSWGNGWAYLALAELYEKLNRLDLAESCFIKSVDYNIDPPNPNYRSNCAAFLLGRGKAKEALELFWKALEVAVAHGTTATIPDIIAGIRSSAEKLSLSKEEVDARIALICGHISQS